MALEEIAKVALENPELTAGAGSTVAYSATTYLAGRSQKMTETEAEIKLEEGFYNRFTDYLKGLYGKGLKDACEYEKELRQQEIILSNRDFDSDSDLAYFGGD